MDQFLKKFIERLNLIKMLSLAYIDMDTDVRKKAKNDFEKKY